MGINLAFLRSEGICPVENEELIISEKMSTTVPRDPKPISGSMLSGPIDLVCLEAPAIANISGGDVGNSENEFNFEGGRNSTKDFALVLILDARDCPTLEKKELK